jgi:hypothetical protein
MLKTCCLQTCAEKRVMNSWSWRELWGLSSYTASFNAHKVEWSQVISTAQHPWKSFPHRKYLTVVQYTSVVRNSTVQWIWARYFIFSNCKTSLQNSAFRFDKCDVNNFYQTSEVCNKKQLFLSSAVQLHGDFMTLCTMEWRAKCNYIINSYT